MNRIMNGLWITDISMAQTAPKGRFDHVVTVCQDTIEDNVGCSYSFFPMADGPHNAYGGDCSYALFEKAVDCVVRSIGQGQTVLVHCHMGQSRSAAVCIAAYAVLNGVHYDDAYSAVRSVRNIHPDGLLVKHAKQYIDQKT